MVPESRVHRVVPAAATNNAEGDDMQRRPSKTARKSACLPHVRLDRRLAVLAREPARFAGGALLLCGELDSTGQKLEISDPLSWRGAAPAARVQVENQFSSEIESMRTMDREEELRLALRIEFARIRLQCAEERARLLAEEPCRSALPPPDPERRRCEWHALRVEMVERNLYLVLINVERYRHIRADRSDLIQAASAALFRAVDGYDWRRGVLFRTYAVHWLNQGFRSYLYNLNSAVRVPVYLQKSVKHVHAAMQRLDDPFASDAKVALEAGLRPSMVAWARNSARGMRSLDAPLDRADGGRTLASELARPDESGPGDLALEGVTLESGVESALDALNPRERRVVELRFGIGCERPHIYSEVAAELGVSLERVRQILLHAIEKMRTPRLRKLLDPLLG